MKWVIQNRLHEGAALDVDDADFSFGCFKYDRTVTRRPPRIIHRAQQTWLSIDERKDFFLVPDMVAGCDNRNSGAQEIDGDFARNTATASSVLAIDDHK